jgi:hypothetical protein
MGMPLAKVVGHLGAWGDMVSMGAWVVHGELVPRGRQPHGAWGGMGRCPFTPLGLPWALGGCWGPAGMVGGHMAGVTPMGMGIT